MTDRLDTPRHRRSPCLPGRRRPARTTGSWSRTSTSTTATFLAVKDVNMVIEPRSVTALIGPSGCGKSTFIRSLNRMHEVIDGAHVKGSVVRRRRGPLRPRRRPGRRASQGRHGLPAAEPVPDDVDRRQRARRQASQQQADQRRRDAEDLVEKSLRGREPLGRGQGPSRQARLRAVRRAAAAALHRPGDRRRARDPADGRAVLGARPDLDAGDRAADERAQVARTRS